MKSILSIVVFFLWGSFVVSGQSKTEFIGKWVFMDRNNTKSTLILESDSTYLLLKPQSYPTIKSGNWNLNDSAIYFSNLNLHNQFSNIGWWHSIESKNESTITLQVQDQKGLYKFVLQRDTSKTLDIYNRKTVQNSSVPPVVNELISYNYDKKFYLVHSMDSTKRKRISSNGLSYNYLIINKPLEFADNCYKEIMYSGSLLDLKDTLLLMEYFLDPDLTLYCDSVRVEEQQNYSQYDDYSSYYGIQKSINIKQITYMNIMTPRAAFAENAGVVFMTLGVLTAIASPLVSYNFKKKEFNGPRFRTIGAIGVGSFGVGVGLGFLSKSKERRVDGTKTVKNACTWYLVAE